jgi:glucan phosphoethanolaminetransferase (alkaline phosphatase superfamily)
MIEDTPSKAGKAFWVIALIGFLLPWIVIIFCQIYFGQAAEIRHFPAHLFESGYNFFLVAVMNATPFAIVAVSARFLLRPGLEQRVQRSRLAGLGTAVAFAMIVSLFAQIGVWSNVFNPNTHASLAGVGIFFLFWVALAVLPVGYLLGWAAGRSF